MRTPTFAVAAVAASVLILAGCAGDASPDMSLPPALEGAHLRASIADANTAVAVSDGDLWPSCWSDDDALYAANGDGAGFGDQTSDIVVNRITGTPQKNDFEGEALAAGDQVGQVWSGNDFTRKPTGMLCVGGSIYLAVQDLRKDFNEAPAATIARSDDHGKTWTWDTTAPMFHDHVFTTVWFADYGKDSSAAPDAGYAYAYGLDGNWRDSFDDSVPDPTELFLARVPVDSVQDASTWEFYAGEPGTKDATWTTEIAEKRPVLVDSRVRHPLDDDGSGGASSPAPSEGAAQTVGAHDLSVLSQGGVTWLPRLGRYVYTSWTELTYEFYEAPRPWGPWTLFLSKDFGAYPWTDAAYGGYGTTVPSKFLSDDDRTAWVQSNVCPCANAGTSAYWFGLRPLQLEPVSR